MKATDMNIELKGTEMAVKKHMLSDPRRIGKIDVTLTFPSTLQLEEKEKIILQRVGDNCPVKKSLSADVEVNTVYNW